MNVRRAGKTMLIVLGTVLLSTLATQASDIARNVRGNLLGSTIASQTAPCGTGAVEVNLGSGPLCVDIYEASPSQTCPHAQTQSQLDTQDNLNVSDCHAVSVAGVMPWTQVSLAQAQQLCARSGKRLPTNAEWYALASGQGDQTGCVTNANAPEMTGSASCVTATGVHDMVGNVWEWIDGEVTDGQYASHTIPTSGYVASADQTGIVVTTDAAPHPDYGADYAITDQHGVRGIIRGGFYGSGSDAGIYAQNLAVALDLKAPGVGFRCVESLH